MATTDPNDKPSTGYTFKEWLARVAGFFNGQSKFIVSTNSNRDVASKPAVAIAAQRKFAAQHSPGQLSRMEEAKLKNKVWNRDLEQVIHDRLKLMFHPENYARMRLTKSQWTNVMRRIVEDISLLYENPARRAFETDKTDAELTPDASSISTGEPDIDALSEVLRLEGSKAEDASPLDALLDLFNWDTILEQAEKMVRIHEAVWIRPYVRYEKKTTVDGVEQGDISTGKLDFILYDPSCADVVEDPENYKEALAWYYWANEMGVDGTYRTIIHFFTPEKYYEFDHQWNPLEVADNPIGRLPVTVFRIDSPPTQSYYCLGQGRDLLEATIEFCILRTIQNSRFKDSAFKQLALTGEPDSIDADQVMGGPTPIFLPDGGTATVLDMQTNLQSMTDLVEQRALELAATYGISAADYKATGGPQSGFAKRLDRDRVLKENRRLRKHFASSEEDLYKNVVATLEAYPIDSVPKLDAMAEFYTDFAEPSFEEDPQNQMKIDASNIKLNLISVIDVLKRENPDLDEKELIRKAWANKRINEAFIAPSSLRVIDFMTGVADKTATPADGGTSPADTSQVPNDANSTGALTGVDANVKTDKP